MTRLYIGNVSTKVDTSELKELLSECGKIKQFDIKEGSGFMVKILSLTVYQEFETPEEAEEAIRKFHG